MVKQVVQMPGAMSNRTDRNLVERTQRIQRDAKMQNAVGGPSGMRKDLTELASGAATAETGSATSANVTAGGTAVGTGPTVALPPIDAFAPGAPAPLSHGADGGPGANSGIQQTPVDSIDQGSALIRAMYLANPTPQMRLMVEAFNEEGR
jgi:hypothetical protein